MFQSLVAKHIRDIGKVLPAIRATVDVGCVEIQLSFRTEN